MSVCKFCSRELDPVTEADDTCESCWYGMRLEPEEFEADMKARGVELADGGHGFDQLDDGSTVHFNRAPYRLATETAPVNPTRAELDAISEAARKRRRS